MIKNEVFLSGSGGTPLYMVVRPLKKTFFCVCVCLPFLYCKRKRKIRIKGIKKIQKLYGSQKACLLHTTAFGAEHMFSLITEIQGYSLKSTETFTKAGNR